jgi:antitoxin component of RelBE/YafQ-DinJ toxin-antitoxin module
MTTTVQARLDEETQAALDRLWRQHGLKPSDAVREGIRLLDKHHALPVRPRMIGIGKYDSGIPDLATNKKHMEGFGVKSMGKGCRPPKARAR